MEHTAAGNAMISRVVLLLYLLDDKNIFWVVEQPQSSLMEKHPRWQECHRLVCAEAPLCLLVLCKGLRVQVFACLLGCT